MDSNHSHDITEGRSPGYIGQIMRPSENPTGGNRHCGNENGPSCSRELRGQYRGDRDRCRRMSGRKRVPSAPPGWGELKVAGMHELGAGTANGMLENIGDHPHKPMRDEALPAGVFPLRIFQSVPDRQQHKAQDHQRLPLAEAVTEIAELNQPGIGGRTTWGIEGPHKPGQRHIPLK